MVPINLPTSNGKNKSIFFSFMLMKMPKVLLLHFIGWWGWIILFVLNAYKFIPDKWYIVLPIFALTTAWAFFMHGVAQKYREKN